MAQPESIEYEQPGSGVGMGVGEVSELCSSFFYVMVEYKKTNFFNTNLKKGFWEKCAGVENTPGQKTDTYVIAPALSPSIVWLWMF